MYIIYLLIISILIIYIYIRLKYKFWCIQPVFHFYDFSYWFYNKGIIREELPEKNKYTNFNNIKFYTFKDLQINNKKLLKDFVYFIQNNYLKNNDNKFEPSLNNIIPYFQNHYADSYFSFYKEDKLLEDIKNNNLIKEKKLIGVMTTRPLHVNINNKQLDIYYVDYLCVDKQYRKKNIAPQIIQTHEYLQSHSNKKIGVSLFKREDNLTGIVPICIYKTFCFNMQHWLTPFPLKNEIVLLKGDGENLYYLYSFINKNKNNWDLTVLPEISNLIELVRSKNIYIVMIMIENEIEGVYFFRKVCTSIKKGQEVISCFASIKGNIAENDFIHGFKLALSNILKEYKLFYYLCIENISDNNLIINNILIKSIPISINPTAYFFYNFAHHTLKSNKCLIIN
jgi:hypothetical protein